MIMMQNTTAKVAVVTKAVIKENLTVLEAFWVFSAARAVNIAANACPRTSMIYSWVLKCRNYNFIYRFMITVILPTLLRIASFIRDSGKPNDHL
jgi:hypothetical protein